MHRTTSSLYGIALAMLSVAAGPAAAAGQHAQHTATDLPPRTLRALDDVRASTERYRDHAVAVEDGYVLFGRDGPLMGEHWYRRDLVRAPLDLNRPSTLQYAWIGGRRELIGVAYTVYRAPTDPLPEGFAGAADAWHVHDVERIAGVVTEGRPLLRRVVEQRRRRAPDPERTHLTMLHAWVWLENPDGVFALEHRALPYVRAGLPAQWAHHGDADAAQGTALLDRGACDGELARLNAIVRLDRTQRSRLASACADAADAVARARAADAEGHAFNRAAGAAWRGYAARRDGLLRAEQRSRLTSLVDHVGTGAAH